MSRSPILLVWLVMALLVFTGLNAPTPPVADHTAMHHGAHTSDSQASSPVCCEPLPEHCQHAHQCCVHLVTLPSLYVSGLSVQLPICAPALLMNHWRVPHPPPRWPLS